MTGRRRALSGVLSCLAALAALLVVPAGSHAAPGTTPGFIVGEDGLLYLQQPAGVYGQDGWMFYGQDFDQGCHFGAQLEKGFKGLAHLAHVIEHSGRRVLFTVAPTKAAVLSPSLLPSPLPHGACDQLGLSQQDQLLDGFKDPAYVPLRQPLRAAKGQTYWKTDPHWTGVGGAVFTHEVAERLDPKLARRQHYTMSTFTMNGLLDRWLGDYTSTETVPEPVPVHGVTTVTSPDSPEFDGLPTIVFDYSWSSTPAKKTWPGHTTLIGDSFTLYALRTLKPLFRHGRFVFTDHVPPETVIDAVKHSRTVVIEVVQFLLMFDSITEPAFIKAMHQALK